LKHLVVVLIAAALAVTAGCGAGKPALMGQLPAGYDLYLTFNPESVDLAGILETLGNTLPNDILDELDDSDLNIDPFKWEEWKEELGIQDGEIGVISLTENDELVAFFLPCGDGSKLKEFIEESDLDEPEYFSYGEYTVMVIVWDDDDLLDDLEDALENEPVSSDESYTAMLEASGSAESDLAFMFAESVAEVPVYGTFNAENDASVLKVTVITDDDNIEQYSSLLGSGLLNSDIMFPVNTMAATRFTLDMDQLADNYDDLADAFGSRNVEDIENALPAIGFGSIPEFLAVFQGDFCVALQALEVDSYGEPEGGEAMLAISLTDSEKLVSALSMGAIMAEAETDELDGVTAYSISEGGEEFWFFIADDVLYASMNIDPEDILDGITAGDYFGSGEASQGFMGGAADPERVMEGISADNDVEDIITAIFEDRAEFSIASDGQVFTLTAVAGPGIIKTLVTAAVVMGVPSTSFN
jgi:hypothetical protein